MKNNGFTLIELLAVIVILAIIALIATPIILGIINSVKEQTKEISTENYIDAIEQSIVRKNMTEIFRPTECIIEDKIVTCEGKELKVEVDGEVPISGTIKIDNGSVANGTELNFKEFKAIISNEGELVIEKIGPEEGPEHLSKDNVRAVTTPTTGIVPTQDSNGNIVPGSEFKIKVSNNIKDENGNVVEYTFFVLSNEGEYVNLIAEQNITSDGKFTSEEQDNNEWHVTSSNTYDNRYGPQTAYTYLSEAISNWTNIPIIESFNYLDEGNQSNSSYGYKSIVTTLNEGKYITTITPYSSEYGNPATYENMRVRLPYVSEVTANTNCLIYNGPPTDGSCPLWVVNYLYDQGINYGYWLSSSDPGNSFNASYVSSHGNINGTVTLDIAIGIRPVITILKSDLLRVME